MFTKEDLKGLKIEEGKKGDPKSDKRFNRMMDEVPMRVVDAKPELKYYTNPDPSMADHIEFLQSIINSSRILMKSRKVMSIATKLFRQGFLFRHQRKAIAARATKYSRTEEKWEKERREMCSSCGDHDHKDCEH